MALDARGKEYMIEAGETYVITARDVKKLSDFSQAEVGDEDVMVRPAMWVEAD